MCVERSNERPEGVRVSKVCGCRGLVGIEGVVEGVGVAALRVHGHEHTHSCVLRSGVRCYIINGQMGGTHLDHTSSSSLASSSSSLMLMKFHWHTGAASTGGMGQRTQRVLGNESEQRETTKIKKDALMNTGPRKKNQRWRNTEGAQDGRGVPKKVSVRQ